VVSLVDIDPARQFTVVHAYDYTANAAATVYAPAGRRALLHGGRRAFNC
jgi:hypothetical protein